MERQVCVIRYSEGASKLAQSIYTHWHLLALHQEFSEGPCIVYTRRKYIWDSVVHSDFAFSAPSLIFNRNNAPCDHCVVYENSYTLASWMDPQTGPQ